MLTIGKKNYTHTHTPPITVKTWLHLIFRLLLSTGAQAMGTCRIFMAPHNDEKGTPFLFRDQRLMMCEMDRFTVACNFNKFKR